MSLWRWMWRGAEAGADGTSDMQRLEQLLYRLADDIANDDDDAITLSWSRQVRAYAGQVGAGQPSGLRNFLRLFDTDPRNTINEQRFARTRTFDQASRLANKLLGDHDRVQRRLGASKREVVLRPWREGSTGKAVVYADGAVITSEDDVSGEPQFEDVRDARQRRSPVALVGIKPDGSCDASHNLRDEPWLAARLLAHDPLLHLEPPPSPV